MLRKYPFLGYVVSIVILAAYLGLLYYIMTTFMGISFAQNNRAATPDYAGLSGRTNQNGPNKIMVTTNGGKNWSRSYDTYESPDNLACPDVKNCFAVSGSLGLLTTGDGGKTWVLNDTEMLSSSLTHISCPKSNVCFALGVNGRGYTFLSSTDRAVNWTAHSFGQIQKGLNGLACPTTTSCFVVGDLGRILVTTDAGKTWDIQTSGTDRPLLAISCATATNCSAVGQLGTLLSTNDGLNWTKPTLSYDRDYTAVSCPTAQNCYALGGNITNGKFLATEDGGKSWQAIATASNEGYFGLSCPGVNQCYVAGASGMVRYSSDGGKTWQSQPTGLTQDLNKVVCPSETTCYVLAPAV